MKSRRHVESLFHSSPFFTIVADPASVIMGLDWSRDRIPATLALEFSRILTAFMSGNGGA